MEIDRKLLIDLRYLFAEIAASGMNHKEESSVGRLVDLNEMVSSTKGSKRTFKTPGVF